MIEIPGEPRGTGLLIVAKSGPDFELFACDLDGRPRPAWVQAVEDPRTKLREVPAAAWAEPRWADRVRELLARIEIAGAVQDLEPREIGPGDEVSVTL